MGLTRAGRWRSLHTLFDFAIDRQHQEPVRAVEALFLETWKGTTEDAWKRIEGRERNKTPLSDHLLDLFSKWGGRFAGLTPDFELMFERFEVLGSLTQLEQNDKTVIEQALADTARRDFIWMPIGRAIWHQGNKLIQEITSSPMKEALSQAGFGKGDPDFIDVFARNFGRMAGRMRW